MQGRRPLTPKQREVYEFVRDRIVNHGLPPSLREIRVHFGIRTRDGILVHLAALEKKGFLVREPGLPRSIRLVRPPTRTASLPLAGQDERIDFGPLFDGGDVCCLRVEDESLSASGLTCGDHLVVRRAPVWEEGDLVVCVPDGGDATVRRLYRDGKRFRLESPTGTGKPTVVRDVEVVGVVQGMVRTTG